MLAVRIARPSVALAAVALAATTLGVLAGPAGAKSTPPAPFKNDLIVVQKSIGGITLGSTEATARRSFPKKDCQPGECSYSGGRGAKTYSFYFQSAAASSHATPHVASISLSSDSPTSAASELKTNKGIGIGSTVHAVKKAYPNIKGSAADGGYYLGSGDHVTVFGIDKGRVNGISMRNQHLG